MYVCYCNDALFDIKVVSVEIGYEINNDDNNKEAVEDRSSFNQGHTLATIASISSQAAGSPSFKPTKPTAQPITPPPTMPRTCSQICTSSSVICPVPGFNNITEGVGAVGTYYYVMHGSFPVVYNASVTVTVADLNNGTDTTACTQSYSRALDDVSFI
jgi:hypothetical protein